MEMFPEIFTQQGGWWDRNSLFVPSKYKDEENAKGRIITAIIK